MLSWSLIAQKLPRGAVARAAFEIPRRDRAVPLPGWASILLSSFALVPSKYTFLGKFRYLEERSKLWFRGGRLA